MNPDEKSSGSEFHVLPDIPSVVMIDGFPPLLPDDTQGHKRLLVGVESPDRDVARSYATNHESKNIMCYRPAFILSSP